MMIKKYILFFIITGLIISIIGPANANTNSPSDLDLFNSIMKKHNLDFDKKKELLGDTYNCFSKDSDHKKNIQSGLKLLRYYEDRKVNFPDGISFFDEGPNENDKWIIKIVNNLAWCFQEVKEQRPIFVQYIRKMIDNKILNTKTLYPKDEKKLEFGSAWMHYSWIVSSTGESIEKRWPYDEKILKILYYDIEENFNDIYSYILFSDEKLIDNSTRPIMINYFEKFFSKKKLNFKDEKEKKDYLNLSERYLSFLHADKKFKDCLKFSDQTIKKIDISYEHIKNSINLINYSINCEMQNLDWDRAYDAYLNKITFIDKALKNYEFNKENKIMLNEQLVRSLNAISGALTIIGYTEEDEMKRQEFNKRAEKINNEFMKKESKYFYLILNQLLLSTLIYDFEFDKAEKILNSSLLEVEKLTLEDGYPYDSGFELQRADLEASYLETLSQIFVSTKRYKEAIAVNEKIIESSIKILSSNNEDYNGRNIDIVNMNNMEAFRYRNAYLQLFQIYNLVSDRGKQEELLKIIDKFCNVKHPISDCMFFFQQRMLYAIQTGDLEIMKDSYDTMEIYYNKFTTNNLYIKYMTDTELLKHKITIWTFENEEFLNNPQKKDSKEHVNLQKNICKEIKKYKKRTNRIEKELGKKVKNASYKERNAYIKAGTYFVSAGVNCAISKNDTKKAISLFNEIVQFEKSRLNKWMNLPSNFYQYEIDSDLISQMGGIIAFYKDENYFDNSNKHINLLKEIFSLSQYGKNLFITNSIKNSVNQKISNNPEIKNLLSERNKITTRLDLLMKDIINNQSINDNKFEIKNNLESQLVSINNNIKNKFPDFEKNLRTKLYTVEDIQKELNSDEVLIVYDSFDMPFAHIIYKDDYDTFQNSPLNVKKFRKLIYSLRKDLFYEKVENLNLALDMLYKTFFEKIDKKILNYKNIIIISDKFTEDLPFGMLFNKDENKYLTEKYSISYQPSVGSFVELRKEDIDTNLSYESVFLGVGDPKLRKKSFKDYIVSISDIGLNTRGVLEDSKVIKQKYENLPYTKNELISLSKIFNNNKILLSNDANEENVKNLNLEQFEVISFATHAAVSGTLKETSEPFLVLTPPKKTSYLNDGILTASEISQLNLNAKLIILSACNTASKENEYAPGFSGLVAAFFKAGTKSVLATHWPIADKASAIMINETINKTVNNNIDLSKALQLTKKEFINGKYGEKYKSPAYWASYVIIGK